jgi:IBR domain, a half RING-finger domain
MASAPHHSFECQACTYLNEGCFGSEAPIACQVCGTENVQNLERSASEQVAEVTGVSRKAAKAAILRTPGKDPAEAADLILSGQTLLLAPPVADEEDAAGQEVFNCPVCLETKDVIDCGTLSSCGHSFCLDDIRSHVKALMKDGTAKSFPCPCGADACSGTFTQRELRFILGDEEYAKLDRRALESCAMVDKSLKTCPTPDCGYFAFLEQDSTAIPLLDCPSCHKTSCLACGVSPYHEEGGPCPRIAARQAAASSVSTGSSSSEEPAAGAGVAAARERQDSTGSDGSGSSEGSGGSNNNIATPAPPAKRPRSSSGGEGASSSSSAGAGASGLGGAGYQARRPSPLASGGIMRPPWGSNLGAMQYQQQQQQQQIAISPGRRLLTSLIDGVSGIVDGLLGPTTTAGGADAGAGSSCSSSIARARALEYRRTIPSMRPPMPPAPFGSSSSSSSSSASSSGTAPPKAKPCKTMAEIEAKLDPTTLEIMKASNGSMKPCPRCLNLIERSSGCAKMMCKCGYRFCYECLAENASSVNGCYCTPAFHGFINNRDGGSSFDNLNAEFSPS